MKKKLLFIAITGLMLASCAKDIEMCVDGDMTPDEPGTYTYTWCGTNADQIEWSGNTGNTLSGESVTLTFDNKGTHGFSVNAQNKRKDAYEYYTVTIGEREGRIEPLGCSEYLTYHENIWAYLYPDFNALDDDFRSGSKANCIDSVELLSSTYYGGTNDHNGSEAIVAGIKGISEGSYVIYLQEKEFQGVSYYGINNLADMMMYTSTSLLDVTSESITNDWDVVATPQVNDLYGAQSNDFLRNLVSKTYLLTDVYINSVQTPVSPCNADDELIFRINKTWEQNVGADDCSGNQTTSVGTFAPTFNICSDYTSSSFQLTPTSGSLAAAGTVYLYYYTANQIRLQMWVGSDMIEQYYTMQ